jgi:predicted ferric reductase
MPSYHDAPAGCAPACRAQNYQVVVLVGTGIGVTPSYHNVPFRLRPLPTAVQDYEVVVLVGAGIGVTPFASVLADMVNKLESGVCTECGPCGEDLLPCALCSAPWS